MNREKAKTLLLIVIVGLEAAGIIFLLISIFGENKSNWVLSSALFCLLIANLLIIVRTRLNKKKQRLSTREYKNED